MEKNHLRIDKNYKKIVACDKRNLITDLTLLDLG